MISVSERMEAVIFCNDDFSALRDLYISKAETLYEHGRVYALKHADLALCKEIVKSYVLSTKDELSALLERDVFELWSLAVEKLNACREAVKKLKAEESEETRFPFSWYANDNDAYLIESGYEDAIRLYLPERELSPNAEYILAGLKNEELLSLYLSEGKPAPEGLVNLLVTAAIS